MDKGRAGNHHHCFFLCLDLVHKQPFLSHHGNDDANYSYLYIISEIRDTLIHDLPSTREMDGGSLVARCSELSNFRQSCWIKRVQVFGRLMPNYLCWHWPGVFLASDFGPLTASQGSVVPENTIYASGSWSLPWIRWPYISLVNVWEPRINTWGRIKMLEWGCNIPRNQNELIRT